MCMCLTQPVAVVHPFQAQSLHVTRSEFVRAIFAFCSLLIEVSDSPMIFVMFRTVARSVDLPTSSWTAGMSSVL